MDLKPFSGKERRAYFRLERSMPVRFKVFAKQESKTFTARTKNISKGGLCLEIQQDIEEVIENLSDAGYKIGVDLDALIPRPNTAPPEPVWIKSRVDWARKPTPKNQAMLMGLEFEGACEEARRRIHDYIVTEMVKRYGEYN